VLGGSRASAIWGSIAGADCEWLKGLSAVPSRHLERMFEGLPAMPPVDRDDSEKQRKAQAHFGVLQFRVPELRRKVQTTIPCLLHSLLSGIQEWMMERAEDD
jgi:hypothetical protein